jgi:hypothetical protein
MQFQSTRVFYWFTKKEEKCPPLTEVVDVSSMEKDELLGWKQIIVSTFLLCPFQFVGLDLNSLSSWLPV